MQSKADFIYQARPARVIFGAGSLHHLEREVVELGAERAIVLCTPEQRALAQDVIDRLGSRGAGIYDRATMHVPLEIARDARAFASSCGADCAIAIGGGSTVGLGKAIALESSLPILAIPTTYAGSEMTPIYGVTDGGIKRTGTDMRVLPKTVIYDPELTVTLPVELSVASGINAIAHAAEGLYANNANPVMSLIAEEGIRALAKGLPGVRRDGGDLRARSDALYGAWLCGMVLGNVGMALHHKLCHTLGGSFNLPHAQTHTVVLPHALAYNAAHAPDAMRRIARAIGADDAARGLYDLARDNGAPVALKVLGMKETDLDRAADLAVANPYWNPRPVEREALRVLLQYAFEGAPPRIYKT
ncbi:maleylacetate reductase [Burkholderia puraquae]|uniref:maleylacetate reductase n=1 Tax=Burkholderia puraquae TaxID=1904757 RepID=A0A1X1PBL6_9BURK|nr:maleylacetate reductase [Burkholderia puraquae]ORT83004.1 maleylacetate reductase [Burkholderia puraquae]CAB3745706.1 Maleylacetate reductase [Burkholderia puraquae]